MIVIFNTEKAHKPLDTAEWIGGAWQVELSTLEDLARAYATVRSYIPVAIFIVEIDDDTWDVMRISLTAPCESGQNEVGTR